MVLRAQTTSPLGRFSVDYVKGCTPLTVNITDLSGSGVSVYQYEGSSSATTNQTSFTYNSAGQYYLVQTIQNLSPRQDSLLIEVIDPVSPQFDLFTCEGLGVSVIITDNFYDQYEIDFGDGSILTTPLGSPVGTHFYSSAGTFTINVRGIFTNAFDNCGSTSKTFTTINAINPAVINTLVMLGNGDMVLNYSLGQNILYDIQIAADNGTIFQKLKSISNQSSSDTIRNLNTTRDYCFRIISFDPCAGNTISSNSVCSVKLTATAQDSMNDLAWQTVQGHATDFIIERDMIALTNLQGSETAYSDADINCNQQYCYQVRANFTGGAQAISTEQCVTSFSNTQPAAITNISVTVNNSDIEADWITPAAFTPNTYVLEGDVLNSGFQFIDSLMVNNRTGLDSAGCFRVYYEDTCGNISSVSPTGCQIMVSTGESQNNLQINWTDYAGWNMGVSNYSLEVYDQNMNLISMADAGSLTNYSLDLSPIDEQVLYLRVVAIPSDAALNSINSDFVIHIREPIIKLPSAFTPDNDGLNDTFQVVGKFINSITFLIFDKWGKLVFTEEELGSGWDGMIGGKPAPPGSYVYKVEVKDFTGREFKRSGSFVLLR